MFLFLQLKNGYAKEGTVQYLLKDGNIRWGHLVADTPPIESEYEWKNLGTADQFIKNKQEHEFSNFFIMDTPGFMDTNECENDEKLKKKLPKKKNLRRINFKNTKRKEHGKEPELQAELPSTNVNNLDMFINNFIIFFY